jgi:hypothetical protein
MKFTVLTGFLCFTLLLSTGCAQKGAVRDAARNEVINGQGSESTMETVCI